VDRRAGGRLRRAVRRLLDARPGARRAHGLGAPARALAERFQLLISESVVFVALVE
jgi:hypothetical protein